ncbi:hypothetical protein EW145_g3327 [Phellinidium pouzarii]|uniref:Xylanolytic transcriptional activator regulatory domain-containing protein n=1 Tax=Phellinidium pouzarii TaxID=167371 RepID=A0A4S4L7R0_9AGAM|nr:hypothetical protein EW145_g3327 [Phellinidium pouzarii]
MSGTNPSASTARSVSSPTPVSEEISESKTAPPPKERRFKLSRRRRIKCDEGLPCQSCTVANSACTFEEPGKRTHPHKSKRATTLEDRMHHLESLIQSIPFNLFGAQAAASVSAGASTSGGAAFPSPLAASVDPSSPHASFASATHAYPLGVPPPSLSLFPLMNPSTHFPADAPSAVLPSTTNTNTSDSSYGHPDSGAAHATVSQSYLYLDDEGYTRWQGETSGLPLLDFLVERERPNASSNPSVTLHGPSPVRESWSRKSENVTTGDWFPDRQPRQIAVHPETMWRLITSMIAPDLMDSLVQCFLSTTYYLMPFLHVPTFLADYGNPQKWGEPGFASFIVAVCCLSSRHVDDTRVRADSSDGFSAGAHWFELFAKLRTVPTADRPTLYTVQSVFVAAIYAIGLGKLSRGFALLAEAATLSIDAGLHRSAEAYDCFGPLEEQVRRRTFWCVYMWDKQAAAAFGRPPVLRLRDCDAPEPAEVDDEFITHDGIGPQPARSPSRLGAFVACLRLSVLLEAVVDAPHVSGSIHTSSPFLARAASVLSEKGGNSGGGTDLRAEEALLDDVLRTLPPFWAHTAETMASADVLRVTQAKRLHCLERFVRMLIERHRFSRRVAARMRVGAQGESEQTEAEREAMLACHSCAVELVHAHTQVAKKGLMTYYGVHVIHQLTQAGRTLIAVLLNCKTEDLQPLVPRSLEALRACIALLRRFSGRYVCGLRSGELIEEFCRLTRIPLDAPLHVEAHALHARPPWIRPVRKKSRAARSTGASASSESSGSRHGSPAEDVSSPAATTESAFSNGPLSPQSSMPTGFPLPLDGISRQSAAGGYPPALSHLDTLSMGAGMGARDNELDSNSTRTQAMTRSLLADLQEGGLAGSSSLRSNGINDMSDINNRGLSNMELSEGSIGGSDGMDMGMGMDGTNGLGMSMGMEGVAMDGLGGLSSSALMTLLNDGSFDMHALFSADFGGAVPNAATPTALTPPLAIECSEGDAMLGVVASP